MDNKFSPETLPSLDAIADEPPAEVVKAFEKQLDDYIDGFTKDMRAGMAEDEEREDE